MIYLIVTQVHQTNCDANLTVIVINIKNWDAILLFKCQEKLSDRVSIMRRHHTTPAKDTSVHRINPSQTFIGLPPGLGFSSDEEEATDAIQLSKSRRLSLDLIGEMFSDDVGLEDDAEQKPPSPASVDRLLYSVKTPSKSDGIPGTSGRQVKFTIPKGVRAGNRVTVNLPTGKSAKVTVPKGLHPFKPERNTITVNYKDKRQKSPASVERTYSDFFRADEAAVSSDEEELNSSSSSSTSLRSDTSPSIPSTTKTDDGLMKKNEVQGKNSMASLTNRYDVNAMQISTMQISTMQISTMQNEEKKELAKEIVIPSRVSTPPPSPPQLPLNTNTDNTTTNNTTNTINTTITTNPSTSIQDEYKAMEDIILKLSKSTIKMGQLEQRISRVKNRYSSKKQATHPRLDFNSSLCQPILQGHKIATARLKGENDPNSDLEALVPGKIVDATSNGASFAVLKITSVASICFESIDDSLAKLEGCENARELQTVLLQFYPDAVATTLFNVYHFQVLQEINSTTLTTSTTSTTKTTKTSTTPQPDNLSTASTTSTTPHNESETKLETKDHISTNEKKDELILLVSGDRSLREHCIGVLGPTWITATLSQEIVSGQAEYKTNPEDQPLINLMHEIEDELDNEIEEEQQEEGKKSNTLNEVNNTMNVVKENINRNDSFDATTLIDGIVSDDDANCSDKETKNNSVLHVVPHSIPQQSNDASSTNNRKQHRRSLSLRLAFSSGALEDDTHSTNPTETKKSNSHLSISTAVKTVSLFRRARKMVSLKKRRYRQDGYDLDLSYVTERVIAMGFPSKGMQGLYRNPRKEVVKFFKHYHSKKFRIYNLCNEREYPCNTFGDETGANVRR